MNPAKIRRRRKNESERWILNKIKAFDPDIIFIYSKDIPLGVLQKIAGGRVPIMMYYEDMRPEVPTSLAQLGRLVDFFLATNKGLLADYKKAGIANPIYFSGACDRHDHRVRHPVLPVWKSDIAFIGQARADESRVVLMRKLAKRFNVKVYGKNWQAFGIKPTLNNRDAATLWAGLSRGKNHSRCRYYRQGRRLLVQPSLVDPGLWRIFPDRLCSRNGKFF